MGRRAKAGLVARDRRALLEVVVAVLGRWRTSRFEFEAAARHGLRAGLCLRGWPWLAADREAADLVAEGLRRIGARRPTWAEGQPEWTQPAVARLSRTRCVRCGARLPDGHAKFCGRLCSTAAAADREWWDAQAERMARAETAGRVL